MGSLEFFSSRLWLGYCALVFVCLMQPLSYMLWITFLLESVIKAYFIEELYYVYVVQEFITFKLRSLV
jgi:hypothetical protein